MFLPRFPTPLLILALSTWQLILPVATTAAAAPDGAIRFAPQPMESRETVVKQFRPMLLHLQNTLATNIDFVFADDYGDIIDRFVADKIDLAYLGPLPYVELRSRTDKAEPLVHFNEPSGKPMYTCAIVAFADSTVTLSQLTGRKIALTQPLSTCGYLAVNGLLQERGSWIEDNYYTYLEKHDAVALAVVRGAYEIGGLKTAIGKKYAHLGLKVVAETAPIPSFGLVANRATLPAPTMQALQQALTGLHPAGADKELLAQWGENIRYGAVIAGDSDYDVVRHFRGDIIIPNASKEQ